MQLSVLTEIPQFINMFWIEFPQFVTDATERQHLITVSDPCPKSYSQHTVLVQFKN